MKNEYIQLYLKESLEKTHKKKTFNHGLALLKVILEFLVVRAHKFNKRSTNNKIILYLIKERALHVPSFFIMSFYFMCNNLLSLNIKIIINRLMRLIIPYIIWPIIIWEINHIWNIKFNTKLADTYEDLKKQLLWGHNFTPQFWFLWNLIIITILLIIIISVFRKHTTFFLELFLIQSYVAQYSELHYIIYKKYPPYKGKTLCLFFESVPYALTGFILGIYKIIDVIQMNKIKSLILSASLYKFITDYNIFINIKGLYYKGIKFNIQSICVIFIFSLLPSEKINKLAISKFLTFITNYTAGVYYLHWAIGNYLSIYFIDIKNGTFLGLFINYFSCYFICYIGMLIFGKTQLKYLFC